MSESSGRRRKMVGDPLSRYRRSQERLKNKTYRPATPLVYGHTYFWVFGFTLEGKKVLWGPYYTRKDADRELVSLEDGEVFELGTRDMSRATREVKAELISRGEDPDEALRKVLHKKEE